MGILAKLLDRHPQEAQPAPARELGNCPHTILLPRWDSMADMGDEEKAVEFVCESCGTPFSPQERPRPKSSLS